MWYHLLMSKIMEEAEGVCACAHVCVYVCGIRARAVSQDYSLTLLIVKHISDIQVENFHL